MRYSKESITAFLDGAPPFDDVKAKALLDQPIVRHMAEDIEELHFELTNANIVINTLSRINSRQRGIMFVAGAVVLGVAVYETNKRYQKRLANKAK